MFSTLHKKLGTIITFGVWPLPGAVFVLSKSHNEKGREEELVTPVVAGVTAESPACTINRVSCYMPTHMGSLSSEILIGRPVGSKFEMVRPYYGVMCVHNTHAPSSPNQQITRLSNYFLHCFEAVVAEP